MRLSDLTENLSKINKPRPEPRDPKTKPKTSGHDAAKKIEKLARE